MNRRYFFPIIALIIAAFLYFFSDRFADESRKESAKNLTENKDIIREEPSLVPHPSTVGALEIHISIKNRETPKELNGSIDLIQLKDDGTDELIKSVEITEPTLLCRFLLPGKYRIQAEIYIPDSDYNLISKPEIIEIIPNKTVRYDLIVP